jgi:hypothetical protein
MLLWIFEVCDNKCELHDEFTKNSASLWAIKALPLIKYIFMCAILPKFAYQWSIGHVSTRWQSLLPMYGYSIFYTC